MEIQPVRIQRSRKHKQVSPNGLEIVYVGRPGKWGNPFKIGEYIKVGNGGNGFIYLRALDAKYADGSFTFIENIDQCLELYSKYIINYPPKNLHQLKGKNLSCWCGLNEKCHADMLLEIANK